MKRLRRVLGMVGIGIGLSFAAQADPPELMSHQGLLTTPSGVVVPDGGYGLRFRICDGPVGENCGWQQQLSVQVKDGVYSVLLSGAGLADVFQQAPAYLEVAITSGPAELGIDPQNPLVMSPRQQIASVPYALSTAKATTSQQGAVELATWSEMRDGILDDRAITPAGLAYASESQRGVVKFATNSQARAGVAGSRALTPANLGQAHDADSDHGYFDVIGSGILVQWMRVTLGTTPQDFVWPNAFGDSSYTVAVSGETYLGYLAAEPISTTSVRVRSSTTDIEVNLIAIGIR